MQSTTWPGPKPQPGVQPAQQCDLSDFVDETCALSQAACSLELSGGAEAVHAYLPFNLGSSSEQGGQAARLLAIGSKNLSTQVQHAWAVVDRDGCSVAKEGRAHVRKRSSQEVVTRSHFSGFLKDNFWKIKFLFVYNCTART